MPQEKSAGCVVYRETEGGPEFLLLRHVYKKEFWKPPKGLIDPSESEEQAALRETIEETGLSDLEIVPGFRETISYFYRKEGQTVYKEVVYFLAKTKTHQVKLSFEHKGFKWLKPEDAIARATHDTDKKVLRKAIDFLKQSRLSF